MCPELTVKTSEHQKSCSIVIVNFEHIQHLKFSSAVGKYQGFYRGISTLFDIYLGKKNAAAIE